MDLDRNTKISASPLKNAGSRMYDNESNEQFDQDLDDQTLAVSIVGDRVLVIFTKARCLTMKIVLQKPAKRNKHFE
ncbi:CIH_collapsed_G0010860.mRNA.1.CDS.1 [Saccharomyces cerevisiae]|nr:CIH_collapsed_G0010860.mRNA.1.CDS.1 [Saccharomyces cerevisiae]